MLVAGLLVAVGATAAELPAQAASPGEPREMRLANGMRVVFQSNPASPVAALCAFVHTSAPQETWNSAGVRELLQLMGERTLVRPDQPAEARPPVMDLRTALSRDYTEIVALCLPEEVGAVLRRLRAVLFEPYFSAESFQFAQERLWQEVAARQSVAPALALDALVARLYPDWPGSWPLVGTGAATWVDLDFVKRYHAKHYLPNRTLLAVSGPLEAETLRQQVEAAFGNLLPGVAERLLPPPVGAEPRGGLVELRMPGSEVSAVVLGGRGPSLVETEYPAASVLMALLGQGRGSRLYRRLREEENLSYTVEAGVTPSQVCPYVYLLATCAADQVGAVREAMSEEVRRLGQEAPSEQELSRARRLVWGQYQLRQQNNEELAHYLGLFALLDETQGLSRWGSLALRLAAVRAEQVQEQARKAFADPVVVIVRGGGKAG